MCLCACGCKCTVDAVTCVRLCVCVCVCDSSSETGDEWASSLGAAGAIFNAGLSNGTAGGVLWKEWNDDKGFERENNKFKRCSVCRSTFHRHGRHAKSDFR